MKTKTLFLTFFSVAMLCLFVVQYGCKKEEENKSPTCSINSPTNGQEITIGETVTISVDATDNDGSITEVRFFIDEVEKSNETSFPYNYDWNTNGENIGNHTLKATSIDNSGGTTSDEIIIDIIEEIVSGTYTDPRDGQTYNTIEIGSQTWFAENLNHETSNSWWYENSSANGDIYGRLYTWDAALTACSNGWHLPSDDEWKTLEMQLGMSQSQANATGLRGIDEGEKMKSTSGWYNNGNGTNSSGFTALPGGYRGSTGSFSYLGYNSGWWSSAERSDTHAWSRNLGYDSDRVDRNGYDKTHGRSVRCLKN